LNGYNSVALLYSNKNPLNISKAFSLLLQIIFRGEMVQEFYLALYNEKTWDEFRESGRGIYGTTKKKENRARN